MHPYKIPLAYTTSSTSQENVPTLFFTVAPPRNRWIHSSVSLSNSKVQTWEVHLYSNSVHAILLNSWLHQNKPVNRNALNSCTHNLALAWFCCEKTLRGVSETVETCFAKGLQHLSCQSERFFDTRKNVQASFMRTAGYLSQKSILRQLAEDLLVF